MPAYTRDVAWKWRFIFFNWRRNLKTLRALYDYDAEEENELTFATDDILYVLDEDPSGWWTAQAFDGKSGLVPMNFLEELSPSFH